MSNYTITTDFGAKDSLPSSNDSKVVRGSEFTTEFTNIQTAIATKADTAGDTFTGVVNFSADVAVNTNTLFVDVSEAKVGIGTASPSHKFHVSGSNSAARFSDDGTGFSLDIEHDTANGITTLQQTNSGGDLRLQGGSSSGLLLFETSGSERMRIDSSGNVGIGTSNPATFLDVNSGALDKVATFTSTDATAFIQIEDGSTTSAIHGYGANGNNLSLYSNGSEKMRIDSSGKVGIGTTSPATALHIDSSGATALTLQRNSGASSNISIKYDGASQDYYTGVASVSEDFVIGTSADLNGNNLLRVTSAGNVGIGTDSPLHKVDITGNASTAYDATSDSGQSNHDATLQIFNSNTTDESFASLVFRNRNSNVGISRISSISKGSGTTDMSFVTEHSNTKSEKLRITSEGNVGIGTTSPQSKLVVQDTNGCVSKIVATDGGSAPSATAQLVMQGYEGRGAGIFIQDSKLSASSPNDRAWFMGTGYSTANFGIGYAADGVNSHYLAQNMLTVDTSGNVLVGKTADAFNTVGVELLPTGRVYATATSTAPMYSNRKSTDGSIMDFAKDGTTVGSIGTIGGEIYIESGDVGLQFDASGNDIIPYGGGFKDATIDLGSSANRFKDIYRSGSTYSTSDRNKKQDIRNLTDAEARVATVAKGSLKAFRYIDSVEAEGDEANIHFGIIAQDLKAAFEAEGLNANDYQVFKTSTYTDDDGVEQTTYSICYENLLAFIIAAI